MAKIEDWRPDDYMHLPDTFELHSHTISGADGVNQWTDSAETITYPDPSGSGVVGSGVVVAPNFAPVTPPLPQVQFGVCYICGTLEDGITVACGLCKDAIRTMREYMLERIKREIAEFAEE